MAYARFNSRSDVYVFESVEGVFECCACPVEHARTRKYGGISASPTLSSFRCATREHLIAHLEQHVELGHKVPKSAFKRLSEELKKYGSYAKNHGQNPTAR